VFARPHKEKEPDDDHLGHGKGLNMILMDGEHRGVMHDLDRDGFDARGRVIAFGVASQLASYSEVGLAFGVMPGVRGPHARHGLRHRT
jgi:hypothetical protein